MENRYNFAFGDSFCNIFTNVLLLCGYFAICVVCNYCEVSLLALYIQYFIEMPFRRFSLHRPFRMTEIRLSGLFLSLDRRSLPPFLARLLSSLRRSPSFRIISEGERTPCPWSFCLGWSEIGRRPCLFPALSTSAVVLTRRLFGLSEIPGLRIRASPVRRRDVLPSRSCRLPERGRFVLSGRGIA